MPDQIIQGKLNVNNLGPEFQGKLNANFPQGFQTIQSKVPYDELPGYTESYDQKGNESRRLLICNWEDSNVFPSEMLGLVTGGTPYLKRQIPEVHPRKTWMYADECHLREGRGAWVQDFAGAMMISFKDAVNELDGKSVFEVIYRPRSYAVQSDAAYKAADQTGSEFGRWVTPRKYFSVENYAMPGEAFCWGQDGFKPNGDPVSPIPEGLAIQRGINELRYRWDWVPYSSVPWQKINATVGKVNLKPFDGVYDDFAYPPGTCLCAAPQVSERYYDPVGNPIVSVEFILLYRADSTWNQFFRKSPGAFQDVISSYFKKTNPPPPPPYNYADFSQLFIPGA